MKTRRPRRRLKPIDSCTGNIENNNKKINQKAQRRNVRNAYTEQIQRIVIGQLGGELDLRYHGEIMNDAILTQICSLVQESYACLTFNFSGCSLLTESSMRYVTNHLGATLEKIEFTGTTLNPNVLKVLGSGLESLRVLKLSHCPNLLTRDLRDIFPSIFLTLTDLDVSYCPNLTDDALCWLAGSIGVGGDSQCRKLKSLNISNCKNIGNRGIAALGKGCCALQFLSIDGNPYVNSKGIVALAGGCRSLRALHLRDCSQVIYYF